MGTKIRAVTFPIDPLEYVQYSTDLELRRRSVEDVLDSYHGTYDILSEAIQNSVDAVEDAKIEGLASPYFIEVIINLTENWIGILDTGVGMTPEQVASAFAPYATFKEKAIAYTKRGAKNPYRGYKGVGLTFLAYGTDDIIIHSKRMDGTPTKGRMQYGRAWARGERNDNAVIVEDSGPSPLDRYPRGTYVQVRLSKNTRPKSLKQLVSSINAWKTILRTKTAIGQILLDCEPAAPLKVKLKVVDGDKTFEEDVEATFLYPHTVERNPLFRFLNLVEHYKSHSEKSTPPKDKVRQDGIYLIWDTDRLKREFRDREGEYAEQFEAHSPVVYAFVPYNYKIWADLNEIEAGTSKRIYLSAGQLLAVNHQRLADITEIKATKYEVFGKNVFVIVHFKNVRPDQGRKTVDVHSEEFAKEASNRVVKYLGEQQAFLRPAGDAPTAKQREIEKTHGDWVFNVRNHAKSSPLHIPPVTYASTPLEEQDVVGLFHQLSALGVFPGIRIYATSQSHTYDCLVEYECDGDEPGLVYKGIEDNPLGITGFILGPTPRNASKPRYATKQLTLEFKNNLDALITDIEDVNNPKSFNSIDICVCWGRVADSFTAGYELEPITETRLDERPYPGVTHLLRHNGNPHVISIIMLKTVTDMILAGQISIPIPLDSATEL